MAPMAVPSHRLRTGTVAWDGIPTAAAVAPPPPPPIAGDICACIPGPTSRSTFFLPAPDGLFLACCWARFDGIRVWDCVYSSICPRRGLAVRFSLTRN